MTTPRIPYAADPNATVEKGPWDISCAPKTSIHLRLLVVFEIVEEDEYPEGVHPTAQVEDGQPAWTIGSNGYEHPGEDRWDLCGWDWDQDCYTASQGRPVAWLEFVPETKFGER